MAKAAPNSEENHSQLVLMTFQRKKVRYARAKTRHALRFFVESLMSLSASSKGTKPKNKSKGNPQVGQPKDKSNPEAMAKSTFFIKEIQYLRDKDKVGFGNDKAMGNSFICKWRLKSFFVVLTVSLHIRS